MSLKYKWNPVVLGNDGFVEEYVNGKLFIRFGPMPRDMVGPFIDERIEVIHDMVKRYTKTQEP